MNDALHMLIGAGLVVVGVLATAVADRIRGLRTVRPQRAEAAERALRAPSDRAERTAIVAEPPPPSAEIARQKQLASEVIAALVTAGYKKGAAGQATWSCGVADRVSLETWTRAALRLAAGGGAS